MRRSEQRHLFYDLLKKTDKHPDAYSIYEQARKVMPAISLGTVYRNLGQLSKNGALITIETDAGIVHYDAKVCDHAHFICEQCGEISDLFFDSDRERAESLGYTVKREKRVFYGICKKCNQKNHQEE